MQDYSQLERFGVHYCHPTPVSSDSPGGTKGTATRRRLLKGMAAGGAMVLATHLLPPLPGLRTLLPGTSDVAASPCPPCTSCCNCAVFWGWIQGCTDTPSCQEHYGCAVAHPGLFDRTVWIKKYMLTEGDHSCCTDGCNFPSCCYDYYSCGGFLLYYCCDPFNSPCPVGC